MSIFRTTDPTQFNQVDGIIVAETAPAPNIAGVAANIVILVGQTQRGSQALADVGSIGEFHEKYGKSDSYGVNTELKNKKFGRLRIVRVLASDAALATKAFQGGGVDRITFSAKQDKGIYGNGIKVKIENAGSDVQQINSVTCVADVADSLDGKYFILPDKDGTVAFWIDTNNSGTAEPVHGADRSVEITTIATGDADTVVATKVATAINGDSQFSAPAPSAAIVLATDVQGGTRTGESAGDSGFTLSVSTPGSEAGSKYTVRDTNTGAVLPDEVYDNVAIGSITSQTFAASQLVTAVVDSSAQEPDLVSFTALASGSDGTVADTDYQTAIALAEVEKAGNFIFTDSYNANIRGYLKQHVANTTDKMCVLAGDDENDTQAEVITDSALYRDSDGRIIYADPWIKTSIGGVETATSPASWYCSILSQTGPHIDPAYAANTQFLAGVTNLSRTITRTGYIALKEAGVSSFEFDDDIGFKVKSGIVTQIANSSKLTVLRRRMADYLTGSVGRSLKAYQNGVNSEDERTEVKSAVLDFIQQNELAGILPKDSEVKTGVAKLFDTESLNTDSSLAQGFFKILYKQRIYSSMRFIVLQAEIGEGVVVTEG